jgi:DNA polymerase-3 subunit epsilon
MATYEILKAQPERYPDLQNDMKSLSEFSTRKKIADFAGMISLIRTAMKYFCKHKGVKVDTILKGTRLFQLDSKC